MSAGTHDHPGLRPGTAVEVAENVFGYIQPDGSWYINNTGFVVGSQAVTCIDAASTEKRTRALRDAIAEISPARIGTLVNTHHHGDHTFGNCVLDAGVIVGHENCRTELLATGPPANRGIWDPVEWGELTLAPPTLTFTDGVRLWSDDTPIEVTYVGRRAHTSNDSVVWLPEQRVLFCGDLLFNGGTPFLLMGSVTGAIEVLTTVLSAYPAETVVPGHGAPCDLGLVPTTVDYLRFVLDTARGGLDAGLTPLETARECDLGRYAGWLDAERIVGNLHRAYADLAGSGEPDLRAAFADMVTYNGGRPLSCYA